MCVCGVLKAGSSKPLKDDAFWKLHSIVLGQRDKGVYK